MNEKLFVPAYCIKCECSVTYLPMVGGHSIWHQMTADGPSEVDICQGPFTFCPPPDDLPEGWQDSLPLPTADEYYKSNIDFEIAEDRLVIVELI